MTSFKTAVFSIFSMLLAALTAAPVFSKDWIIAASAFETGNGTTIEIDAGKTIPTLILDKISSYGSRQVLKSELDMRKISDLRQKRQALFLTLASAIKSRDAIVFSDASERGKKLAAEKAEKEIAKIQKDINANLAEADELAGKTITLKKGRSKTASVAANQDTTESIAVWKGDVSALVTANYDKDGEPTPKNVLDAYINNEKINCYMTGSIQYTRADFAIIKVDLYLYPTGEKFAEVSEIASLNNLQTVANLLSYELFEQIVNKMPAKILFQIANVFDTEAGKMRLNIDGESITSTKEETLVADGVHTVFCEVEGYKAETFTYFFEGGKEFAVSIDLQEKEETEKFSLFNVPGIFSRKPAPAGTFFINAIDSGESPLKFSVNGHTVLGSFTSVNGNTGFFYIPEKTLNDVQNSKESKNLFVSPIDADITKKIDTHRKIMYASYSAVMIAFPLLMFFNGQYTKYADAYTLGYSSDFDRVNRWYTTTEIMKYSTYALVANFAVQLVLYLKTANSVLPAKAKPAKQK